MKNISSFTYHHSSLPFKHRFTLLEMLVVTAVIAILAAMLLPALNHTREAGEASQCLDNLKQMGVGAANYMKDYSNFFPTHRTHTGVRWFEVKGMSGHYNKQGGYIPGNPVTSTAFGAIENGHPTGVWRCPAVTVTGRLHYGLNYYAFGAYPTSPAHMQALNITKVKQPSECLFISEFSQNVSNFAYPSVSPLDATVANVYSNKNPHLELRHSDGANVLFFDGHAAAVTGKDQFMEKKDGKRNPLWGPTRY